MGEGGEGKWGRKRKIRYSFNALMCNGHVCVCLHTAVQCVVRKQRLFLCLATRKSARHYAYARERERETTSDKRPNQIIRESGAENAINRTVNDSERTEAEQIQRESGQRRKRKRPKIDRGSVVG